LAAANGHEALAQVGVPESAVDAIAMEIAQRWGLEDSTTLGCHEGA